MTKALACLFALLSFASSAFAADFKPIPTRRVVMVHGIFQDEWRCFGRLRRELEANGVECLCPSLKPADARSGLPVLAEQLKRAVEAKWSKNERFVLIGFSMGGLVGRHYLQELGGAARCDGIFTVATPHYGTRMAWLWYGEGAHQMRPGSDFLAHLAATEDRLGNIPIVTYRTCSDLMIVPSRSCNWDRALNVTVACPIHALMSCDPNVRQDIVSRLQMPSAVVRGMPLKRTRQQVSYKAARR
jgi:triacylglycerol lipase